MEEKNRNNYWIIIGLCIGTSVGTTIGMSTENLPLWMGVGTVIGLCVGLLLSRKNERE